MAWQLKARIGVQSVSLGKPSIPSFKKNAKKYVFELKQHGWSEIQINV